MDSTIYIPTFRRVNQQVTLKSLQGTDWERAGRVLLVAPPDEVKDLRALGWEVIGCPAEGIGPTRQWIVNQHPESMGEYIFMMDDDLGFYRRRYDDPTKFLPIADHVEMNTILFRLRAMLEQVPLVGLASRSGANRLEPPVKLNGRMHDIQCFHFPTFKEVGGSFTQIRFMEDFNLSLKFLTQGYPTAMLTTHCKDDKASNAPGGCSVYRDASGQAEAAHALAALYPAFVKTAEKPGWGGMGESRTDVSIQWAKAFKAGQEARDMLDLPQHPAPDWSQLAPEWDLL